MENSLVIRTEASYTLNFLVYLQNIYLNQKSSKQEYRFPYFPSKCILFEEEFEFRFKGLWDEVDQRLSENVLDDLKIFHGEKDLFYQRLFMVSEENSKEYNEVYQAFEVWWGSFAGRFSIERSVDDEIQKLYGELALSLVEKRMSPRKELGIRLIYDNCSSRNVEESPYFAIVSIQDLIVNYKEVLVKLEKSIY